MNKSVQQPGTFLQFAGVCPECGAACTGTYKFWYVASNGEDGLECVQSVLDDALTKVLESHLGVGVYSTLPDFIRAYNEGRGCQVDPEEHTRVVIEQLRKLLVAAKVMNAALIFLDD